MASSTSRIERNRRDLDRSAGIRRWASPAIHGLERTLEQSLAAHARGRVLDVGCGAMPYREVVLSTATSYDGLDLERRHPDVRFVASATDMGVVEDGAYDTVLCSEVLEHVDDPASALAEIARVVDEDGTVILSVPFLGRLHEEPHDYVRYTEHGLRLALGRAGLMAESIEPTGSVGAFLGHQVSTALVGATWHVPLLKWVVYALNAALVVAPSLLLDRVLGPVRRKLPLGYVVVARRADRRS